MSEAVKGLRNNDTASAGWQSGSFGKSSTDTKSSTDAKAPANPTKPTQSSEGGQKTAVDKISPSQVSAGSDPSEKAPPPSADQRTKIEPHMKTGAEPAGERQPSEQHHGHQGHAVKHHGHQGHAVKHHGHQGHAVKHHGHQGHKPQDDGAHGKGKPHPEGHPSPPPSDTGQPPPAASGKEPPPRPDPDAGQRPGAPGPDGRNLPPKIDRGGPPPASAAGITGSQAAPGDGPIYRIAASSGDQTSQVQSALDSASANHGTVEFLAGTHMMGATHVGSNTHIRIDEGATILASPDRGAFPPAPGSQHKTPTSLFTGSRVSNVVIDGGGVIDGQGEAAGWYKAADDYKAGHKGDTHGMPRPRLISFDRSTDITIKDITLQNSPKQHIVIDRSQDVTIENVDIYAPPDSPNTDGIDLGGNTNVIVRGGTIDVGDDNVAIEGGTSSGTMGPASKILIDGQTYLNGHGVSIGSNTTAGVHDVTVSNATFDGTDQALRIKSSDDRGGPVSDIHYSNISIANMKHGAIDLNMNYSHALDWKWKPDGSPGSGSDIPSYSRISFEGITVSNSDLGRIWGLSNSRIDEVSFKGIRTEGDVGPLSVRDATINAGGLPPSAFRNDADATVLAG